MNEKVRQIIDNSGVVSEFTDMGWSRTKYPAVEGLVRDIVLECVEHIAPDAESTLFEETWRKSCQREILEHFGVVE